MSTFMPVLALCLIAAACGLPNAPATDLPLSTNDAVVDIPGHVSYVFGSANRDVSLVALESPLLEKAPAPGSDPSQCNPWLYRNH